MGRVLRIIWFILRKIGDWIGYVIIHLIKRVLFLLTQLLLFLICDSIFLITFEPFTWRKATKRKAKRIRALTKLKLYAWKYGEAYFRFINDYKYLEGLYNKYYFLLEDK